MNKVFLSVAVLVGLAALGWFVVSNETTSSGSEIGTKVGDKSSAFEITTIDGKKVRSEDLLSSVVVITSSAAWCSTCVIEAQQFSPVFKKYETEPVTFLTIDIDARNTLADIKEFRQNTDTPWDYADVHGATQLIKDYKLNRFEITYVMDKQGIIRHKDGSITSTEELDTVIRETLSI